MVRRAILATLAIVIGSGAFFAALANTGPLAGNVEALRVIQNANGREAYVPADEAHPQDVIEYRLTYTNTGDASLQNIFITDPIPNGTEYPVRTATKPQEGTVEFSVDNGKSYHAWPILIKKTAENGEEIVVEATPDMVTHIRWTLSDDFEPDSAITLSYRTIVK